jgi:hypothetical protein
MTKVNRPTVPSRKGRKVMLEDIGGISLTPLEHRFVIEYLKDGNSAGAAERAGCKGTEKTFKRLGYQMLQRKDVQQALRHAEGKLIERALLTQDTLINQIQDTIMEARHSGKYDAAFKGYGQLGEILGVLGRGAAANKQTKAEQNKSEQEKRTKEAFNTSDEEMDVVEDVTKLLKILDGGKK